MTDRPLTAWYKLHPCKGVGRHISLATGSTERYFEKKMGVIPGGIDWREDVGGHREGGGELKGSKGGWMGCSM
jgi:hypothetical protein